MDIDVRPRVGQREMALPGIAFPSPAARRPAVTDATAQAEVPNYPRGRLRTPGAE